MLLIQPRPLDILACGPRGVGAVRGALQRGGADGKAGGSIQWTKGGIDASGNFSSKGNGMKPYGPPEERIACTRCVWILLGVR
eukprot:scaffold37_cov329-Pinguiococcus_pyrenoidosus.AAC.3